MARSATRVERGVDLLRLLAIVLALAIVAWGLYVALIGPLMTTISENDGQTALNATRVPDWRGWIVVASGVSIMIGILTLSRSLVIIGLVTTAAFAVVLLFSVGGILVPVVAVLAGLAATGRLWRSSPAGHDGALSAG